MADAGHHNLRQRAGHFPLHAGAVCGWEQAAVPQRNRRQRDIEHESRFQPVTNMGSGCADGKIRLWNAAEALQAGGAPVRTIDAHTDAITSVAFSQDGRWLISGSKDL